MAVADSDDELAGAVRWAGSLTGTYIARVVVWGLLLIALSAPALQLVPVFYPASEPFVWLTIVGLVLAVLTPMLDEEDAETIAFLVEQYQEKTAREKFIYVISFCTLAITGISFEVAVVGVVATLLAEYAGLGILALAVAIWYPAVDAWLGRVVGWNVVSTGGLIGLLVMELVAIFYQVSPEVPRSAAGDFRRKLLIK